MPCGANATFTGRTLAILTSERFGRKEFGRAKILRFSLGPWAKFWDLFFNVSENVFMINLKFPKPVLGQLHLIDR